MHIEPGVVDGAKISLSYLTAAGVIGALGTSLKSIATECGGKALLVRGAAATIAALTFFQVLPHFPMGVSEVHFIFGSSLFLILGCLPAAFGLALGLLMQGLLFAPFDLPQYGMNLTTLLAPMLALQWASRKLIASNTAYVDLSYSQTLCLSLVYQGGITSWVAFWAFYGQGIGALPGVLSFGSAYMAVVLVEPLVDLALLATAKRFPELSSSNYVSARLHA